MMTTIGDIEAAPNPAPSEAVEPYPGELVTQPAKPNLCMQTSFRKVPVYRRIDGKRVATTRLASTYKSLVVHEDYDSRGFMGDDCRHTCADRVIDYARGTIKAEVPSGRTVSRGGFGGSPSGYARGYVRARLRGTPVVLTTMSYCIPLSIASDGQNLPNDCYFEDGTRDCYYCDLPSNNPQGPCAIAEGVPCILESTGRIEFDGNASIPPGLPVYGMHPSSWDISGQRFGDKRHPKRLGDGFNESVIYLLKGIELVYNPDVHEVVQYGECLDWGCHIVIQNAIGGQHYRLVCVEPIRTSTNTRRRQDVFDIRRNFAVGGDFMPVFVHASLTRESNCFILVDQECMTAGQPSEQLPGSEPLWKHEPDGSAKLIALDRVRVDMQMRFNDDATAYPRNDQLKRECVNDVLALLRTDAIGMEQMPFDGRSAGRFINYNHDNLNLWFFSKDWRCPDAPAVPRFGAEGQPAWPVTARLYRSNLECPGELVVLEVENSLRISGETMLTGPRSRRKLQVRVSAMFEAEVKLGVRLKPEPENDVHAEAYAKLADDDGCARTSLVTDVVILGIGEGKEFTYAPLAVKWSGLVAPRPWSSADWSFKELYPFPNDCCLLLHAIDGLVIPGAVNDTSSVSGEQGYDGQVVVTLNIDPNAIC